VLGSFTLVEEDRPFSLAGKGNGEHRKNDANCKVLLSLSEQHVELIFPFHGREGRRVVLK